MPIAENYDGFYELVDRAMEEGGSLRVEPHGLVNSDGKFCALATVTSAAREDGQRSSVTLPGYAMPGDAQGDLTDAEWPVEDRAGYRAAVKAMRAMYGTRILDTQPPWVKQAQRRIRETAVALGKSRDALAALAHEQFDVDSINDVSPEQAEALDEWCATLLASSAQLKALETANAA